MAKIAIMGFGTVGSGVLEVCRRNAASIARRLQDPLAELVKIDPKSILSLIHI